MTPYDKHQIWTELRRLRHEKVNTCPFKDLMNRVNYIESTNNDLINRVARLEDEIYRLDNESATFREKFEAMQKSVQKMGGVLERDRPNE